VSSCAMNANGTLGSRLLRTLAALTTLVAVSASGCGFPPLPGAPPGSVALEMQMLPSDLGEAGHRGTRGYRRLVIRDSIRWLAFWDSLTFRTSPKPPAPAVDFTQDMIVAVSLTREGDFPPPTFAASIVAADVAPEAPPSRYSIHVDLVQEFGGDVWMTVRERMPSRHCGGAAPVNTPVAAVRVPRHDGWVTWIERGQLAPC
jgi:hypothetical protein